MERGRVFFNDLMIHHPIIPSKTSEQSAESHECHEWARISAFLFVFLRDIRSRLGICSELIFSSSLF